MKTKIMDILPDCCVACIHCHEIGSPNNSKFICDLNLLYDDKTECEYCNDEYGDNLQMNYADLIKELNYKFNRSDLLYGQVIITTDDARKIMKLFEEMYKQIEDTHSCKLCANRDVCSPDAEFNTPEYYMFAKCQGSLKENWKWKGV